MVKESNTDPLVPAKELARYVNGQIAATIDSYYRQLEIDSEGRALFDGIEDRYKPKAVGLALLRNPETQTEGVAFQGLRLVRRLHRLGTIRRLGQVPGKVVLPSHGELTAAYDQAIHSHLADFIKDKTGVSLLPYDDLPPDTTFDVCVTDRYAIKRQTDTVTHLTTYYPYCNQSLFDRMASAVNGWTSDKRSKS